MKASDPFRNDTDAVRAARALQDEVEREAVVARRRPWLAFVGAWLAVALTLAFVVGFFMVVRACGRR